MGRIRSSASMMVTSLPNDANTSANSIPMAPAPMIPMDFGVSVANTAWSLLHTRSPSIFSMGSDLGFDPVAMMICFASSVRFSPSDDGSSSPCPTCRPGSTCTFPFPAIRPQPTMWSTLFFFNR
jgi:hypothetical protein